MQGLLLPLKDYNVSCNVIFFAALNSDFLEINLVIPRYPFDKCLDTQRVPQTLT